MSPSRLPSISPIARSSAACAFAAVLYKVVTSGAVLSALQSLIKDALDAKF